MTGRIIVSDDGTTLQARKAYDGAEFLASTDERFRPVYLSNAPDGTLYLVDMYRGVIQHRGYITEYLHDRIVERKLEKPIGYGRIYRIVHEGTPRDDRPAMGQAAAADLVALLSHQNGWRRDTAQRLLVERGEVSVVPELARLAAEAPDARTRLHALWTLDGLGRLEPAQVLSALGDRARDVRVSALRLAEPFVERDEAVRNALLARMQDTDWAVRRQLAASLGALPRTARIASVAEILETHGDDPVVMDAALSGVPADAAAVLTQLAAGRQETPQRTAALTMVAATLARAGEGAGLTTVFERIADPQGLGWQRDALMAGLEGAWLGGPLPGTTARRAAPAARAAAPCPTCPGGRAGPGGASAFPATRPQNAGGRGSSPAPVAVPAEPAIVATAAGTGALAERASKVLNRLTWPGKPGAVVATALSAEDQQRFDRGHEVYRSLCEPCHQADGRGREKMAPTLVGSALVQATDPGVAARVLLNGKEGAVGLMPPLGGTLTDEQIADVLTYIRRAWGQAAAPVTPAEVAPVRAATVGRTRPWTDQELTALAGGGR